MFFVRVVSYRGGSAINRPAPATSSTATWRCSKRSIWTWSGIAPSPCRGLPVPLRELYELREKIFQEHVTYQQGLLYFLANDKQVPEGLQARVNAWGLSPNQFETTGHWPLRITRC